LDVVNIVTYKLELHSNIDAIQVIGCNIYSLQFIASKCW